MEKELVVFVFVLFVCREKAKELVVLFGFAGKRLREFCCVCLQGKG